MADRIDQGERRERRGLRSGDWVVVRSKEEILATLDANARLDELPFQPEMFAFCGKRMRVAKVGDATPTERLDLQPGEWVKVRPQEQILQTITASGFNRGMRYDLEMSKYCGKEYRVQMRVDRLENVYCRAECTPMRLGCPRASNTYWREIWLQRLNAPSSKTARSATRA